MSLDRIIHLSFAALAAFVFARTANDFVEHFVAPAPNALTAVPRPKRPQPPVAPPRLEVARLSTLTGLPLPQPEPQVVEPVIDLDAAPVRTALRLRLLGTLVATPEIWSLASIEQLDTRDTSSFRPGDEVLGAQVLSIDRDRVMLLNNGVREYLDMAGAPPPARPAPPPQARSQVGARPIARPGPALGAGIRATSENSYEVPRSEVDSALGNLNQLALKARIVPAFKDGKSVGFKLFSIRPNSLYAKIGIQNGDIIRRINGYDLNSPEKALEVYMKLKQSSRVDLEVERGGKVVKKTYNIR